MPRRLPSAIICEFTNGDTVKLDDCEHGHVEDVHGERVPIADVLLRLAAHETLFAVGVGRTMQRKKREPWETPAEDEDDAEPVGDPFPVRTLIHLGGIAYASELYSDDLAGL